MHRTRLIFMCKAAVFVALAFVLTAYLQIPAGNGYIHVGDSILFLAACLLPRPYGISVGVCSALLADCLTGYALWAPASVVIKGLSALPFTSRGKLLQPRNIFAPALAALLCVGGYYLYEALIYGSWVSPLSSIPFNLLQSAASTVLFEAAIVRIHHSRSAPEREG